ncbi:uncharacterized protein HD556DRAFT_1329914 [Suillus plorans]|uniref:Uncharacterized protein n=1 Tax=Suillus plorans TaxID=116603 RepID=A0A9P7DUY9_9AGAM|nr:uncharacterized protein HD556DRAFT_1329914 [Suillus plorans]KAG1803730.1 hypothetical protein HD556DRAFT_1329914 [Suillus plorans]
MPSTASQLERSLRKLQVSDFFIYNQFDAYCYSFCPKISESDSQETSTAVQWVPSKYYSSDASQCVLVRPPRAACGNRQLFGFPLIKSELWDMGTFAFKKIWPNRTLPDDHFFIVMNSLTLLRAYLGLRVCTMAFGKVDEGLDNIPSECVSLGEVLLLILWRDTEPEASCPTLSQVHFVEAKLKRSPRWWVEVPVRMHTHFESRSADTLYFLASLMNGAPTFHGWLPHLYQPHSFFAVELITLAL